MARIFISYILPLVLPSVLYFMWIQWVRRQINANRAKAKAEGHPEGIPGDHTRPEDFDIKMPWFRLIIAGVALTVVGLVLSVFIVPQNPPDSVYHAPYEKNGVIIEGEFTPKSKPPSKPASK